MKLGKWGRRGEPEAEDLVDEPIDELDDEPIADAADVAVSHWSSRLVSGLMVAGMALGPLGCALGGGALYWESQRPLKPATTAAVDVTPERTRASELATRVVTAWLTSTVDHPEEITRLVSDVPSYSLPRVPFQISDTQAAEVVSVGKREWAVTVATTVADAEHQPVRRYFRVAVIVDGVQASVPALPTPVAGPVVSKQISGVVAYKQQIDPRDPVAVAVTQFVSTYLTGSVDVARYVAPGTTIVTPAAMFTSVDVTAIRATAPVKATTPTDGETAQLLVSVVGTVNVQQQLPAMFALSVKARGGRWEVTSVDAAPVVSTTKISAAPVAADGATPKLASPTASARPSTPAGPPAPVAGTPSAASPSTAASSR